VLVRGGGKALQLFFLFTHAHIKDQAALKTAHVMVECQISVET
jgi:hypothetical protein